MQKKKAEKEALRDKEYAEAMKAKAERKYLAVKVLKKVNLELDEVEKAIIRKEIETGPWIPKKKKKKGMKLDANAESD